MFLPEAGLHLAAPFLLLLLWAVLRRRSSPFGRALDTGLTIVVIGSFFWTLLAFLSRGIDWRLRGFEIERAVDPRLGSLLASFVVLGFWMLLSSPLLVHGIRSRREDSDGSGWLALPLQCPRPLWRLVRRAMHGLALSALSWSLVMLPFGYSRLPEEAHRFLYRVIDGPISAVNWLLPGFLQSGAAFQFLPPGHGNMDPARYVLIGAVTWAALISLVERLLGSAIAFRASRKGSDLQASKG
jgi:hypothetical protein